LPLRLWQNTLKFMLRYLHEIQQSRFSGILMEAGATIKDCPYACGKIP